MGNPYNYNLPVRAELFLGRDEAVAQIAGQVMGAPGDSVALIGGRRMGKTSLLEALLRCFAAIAGETQPIPLFLDFTGEGIHSTAAFFERVAQEAGAVLGGEAFVLAEKEPPAPAFRRWLVAQEQAARGAGRPFRLVLLLDECEQIVSQPWAGELHGALRFLLVGQPTRHLLKVVMSGSQGFFEQVRQNGSPLRNVLVYHFLRVLPEEALQKLVAAGSLNAVATAVALYSGGHPFLAQYLLHHAWERPSEPIATIAEQFPHERGDFANWADGFSDLGWQVYGLLAEQTSGLTEPEIRAAQADLGPGDLAQALTGLCYHGVVVEQAGVYRSTGEMFRRWFIAQGGTAVAGAVDRVQLRQILAEKFNESELKTLCFDLGLDRDTFPQEGKEGLARDLVAYCERVGRLRELGRMVQRQRPLSL